MTENEQWAWLAGLLEGEGCFSLHKSQRFVGIRISVGSTDRDTIERCVEIAREGSITGPYQQRGNRKPMFFWKTSGLPAMKISDRVYPMLGERRREKIDSIFEEIVRK